MRIKTDKKFHKVRRKAVGNYYSVDCIINERLLRATFNIEDVLCNKYLSKQQVEDRAIEGFEFNIGVREQELKADKKFLKEVKEQNYETTI